MADCRAWRLRPGIELFCQYPSPYSSARGGLGRVWLAALYYWGRRQLKKAKCLCFQQMSQNEIIIVCVNLPYCVLANVFILDILGVGG